MAVYEIEALTRLYPGQTVAANEGITLTIDAGEIFGLLGDSGAGRQPHLFTGLILRERSWAHRT